MHHCHVGFFLHSRATVHRVSQMRSCPLALLDMCCSRVLWPRRPASRPRPAEGGTVPSRGRHCWVPASPGKADVLEGTSRVCRISAVSKSELRFTRGKRCVHDSVAEGTFNILPTAPAPCVNAGAGSGAGAVCLRAGEGVQCPLSRPRAGQAEAWRLRSHWGTLTTHFPPLKSGQVKAQRHRDATKIPLLHGSA